jgi:hypothetical protein
VLTRRPFIEGRRGQLAEFTLDGLAPQAAAIPSRVATGQLAVFDTFNYEPVDQLAHISQAVVTVLLEESGRTSPHGEELPWRRR